MRKKYKRALSTTFVLFEVILVVLIFYFMAGETKEYSEEQYFSNAARVEDMAITIDTIYAAPGNLNLVYQNKLDRERFSMKDNVIEIGNLGAKYAATWPPPTVQLVDPEILSIAKTGEELVIKNGLYESKKIQSSIGCPSFDTQKKVSDLSVTIDPLYGGSETGPYMGTIPASQITSRIAKSFTVNIPHLNCDRDCSRPLDGAIDPSVLISAQERSTKAQGKDLVISVDVGEDAIAHFSQPFRVYYLAGGPYEKEAHALACALGNQFTTETDLTIAQPFGITSSFVGTDSRFSLLNQGKVALYIQFGNTYATGTNALASPEDLGRILARGVSTFYGQ